MKPKLDRIEYRRGMLEKGVKPQNLPVTIWRDEDIPSDILKAIDHENLLALGACTETRPLVIRFNMTT